MALTYNQVSGLTSDLFNESAADDIFDSNAAFVHLKEKGSVIEDGGPNIRLPIEYAKIGAAGTFKQYSILDTNPTDTLTAASFQWKYSYSQMIVSKTELWENSGKSQAVNLLKAKLKGTMSKMRDQLGTQIFSTNADSAEGMNGLRLTVSSTGTVGGIATSDFSGWAGKVSTTTAITISGIDSAIMNAAVGSDEPDLIVTTKAIFKKVKNLFQANQRFGEGETVKGNFKYLMVNFVPVFHDSHVPSKHMFILNSRWLYLYVHKDVNMVLEKVPAIANQIVHIERVLFGGNLVTDNRRMHFKYSLLNYT